MTGSLRSVSALAALLLTGCAHEAAVKPKTAPSLIRRIAVDHFEGDGSADVARECARALTAGGLQVAGDKAGADALLTGVIHEYRSGRKLMIILGTTNAAVPGGQSVPVSNPVVSLAGSQLTPQNPGLSGNNPHIIMENAAVALVARLVDASNGNVLWAYEYSYESMDLPSALQTVAGSMAQSLKKALPRLRRQKAVMKKSK